MRIYLTTCSNKAAAGLARTLLDEHLIACANIMPPHRALYRWQGNICEDEDEVQIWMECSDAAAAALRSRLAALHPYQTPKILEIEPSWVLPAFAHWCEAQTSQSEVVGPPDTVGA